MIVMLQDSDKVCNLKQWDSKIGNILSENHPRCQDELTC